MCLQNGEPTPDTKRKAGWMLAADGFAYQCFRCKFKTQWKPGSMVGGRMVGLLLALGMDESSVQMLKMNAIQMRDLVVDGGSNLTGNFNHTRSFKAVDLPESSATMADWASQTQSPHLIKVLEYLMGRGPVANLANFYWADNHRRQLKNRFIIPFTHDGIIVGYTARYAADVVPNGVIKYDTVMPPGFLFNNHVLETVKTVIVTEGVLDALVVGGVGFLGSSPSKEQVAWIQSAQKDVILLPDFDKTGLNLTDQKSPISIAIANGWSVSFPPWASDFKDATSAAASLGRLFTVASVLASTTSNPTKITMLAKRLSSGTTS